MANLKPTTRTSLLFHVAQVVGLSSEKEVFVANASRVVAAWTVMAYVNVVWNWTVPHLPGVPMRKLVPFWKPENAMAKVSRWPSPKPARIGLADLRPEAGGDYFGPRSVGVMAILRAEAELSADNLRRVSFKKYAAVGARNYDRDGSILKWHRSAPSACGVAGPGLFTQLAASFSLSPRFAQYKGLEVAS